MLDILGNHPLSPFHLIEWGKQGSPKIIIERGDVRFSIKMGGWQKKGFSKKGMGCVIFYCLKYKADAAEL